MVSNAWLRSMRGSLFQILGNLLNYVEVSSIVVAGMDVNRFAGGGWFGIDGAEQKDT